MLAKDRPVRHICIPMFIHFPLMCYYPNQKPATINQSYLRVVIYLVLNAVRLLEVTRMYKQVMYVSMNEWVGVRRLGHKIWLQLYQFNSQLGRFLSRITIQSNKTNLSTCDFFYIIHRAESGIFEKWTGNGGEDFGLDM